jgi:hypothetical protein
VHAGPPIPGVVFNPETMEAFSSQGDGTLTVIKEDSPTSFSVEQTVSGSLYSEISPGGEHENSPGRNSGQ